MTDVRNQRIEFGDFQTPDTLAERVCERLVELGVRPDVVIEPTCGVGAFVLAAASTFSGAKSIFGFDINRDHLITLEKRLRRAPGRERIFLQQADFFATDWSSKIGHTKGSILVLGNFPWVTNAVQGVIGGANLPEKSNFLGRNGFDAISGKSNFDISEWMLLEVLRWFGGREGSIAMLVKTAVARKVLAHVERQQYPVQQAILTGIDAKKEFDASVDACLLVIQFAPPDRRGSYDYTAFEDMSDTVGKRVGHRDGLTVGNLDDYESSLHLVGTSPRKWRSGVKHDAAAIMEFTRTEHGLTNGLGEVVQMESDYLYPLLKGSDVGSGKTWRGKFMLVTQREVGEPTNSIRELAPSTWTYLKRHAAQLDGRGSTIYTKNPRFSVFGVGKYAFHPWRIAIASLYKSINFRLVGPIEGRPVMFDDTVYYISFDSESEARDVLDKLKSKSVQRLISSLVFWDEKRPIKAGILNVVDWSRLDVATPEAQPAQIALSWA